MRQPPAKRVFAVGLLAPLAALLAVAAAAPARPQWGRLSSLPAHPGWQAGKPAPLGAALRQAAAKRPDAAKARAAAAHAVNLRGITIQVPGNWTRQRPASEFRLAQYAVPRAPGDSVPALFIVFYFGKGQGGSAEANIERWIGMMQQPNGKPTSSVAHRGRIDRPGLRITTLDMTGTYLETTSPFSTQATPRPNYRFLGAVIEPTGTESAGSYFFRLVGPARTVSAAKPQWDALLASVKGPAG